MTDFYIMQVKIWTGFAYLSPLMSHYLNVMICKFCVSIKQLLSAHINVFFWLVIFIWVNVVWLH